MDCLELTLPDPAANLALDEALLLEAEEGVGGEVLRLSQWPPSGTLQRPVVVLGSACRLGEDVHEEACLADGVPILRRSSGGGTVLWGPGCLLYSLVLRYDRDPALAEIRPSYAWILERVARCLGVPGVVREGISDLAIAGRKFSGNAQQRKRRFLLHHGFDAAAVSRYLRPPPRQPEYRAGREHADFLCSLPLSAGELKARLRREWDVGSERTSWPAERVAQLCREKYDLPAWTRRL
jgi:lipoate-protein ligase A